MLEVPWVPKRPLWPDLPCLLRPYVDWVALTRLSWYNWGIKKSPSKVSSRSTMNRMTGLDSCRWLSLLTTMPKTPAPATRLSNWTMVFILESLSRKTSTLDPTLRPKSASELANDLRDFLMTCQQNLLHAQELQKRAHDKGVKPRSYAPGKKVWLNSNYIKTKRNQKLGAKFFWTFSSLASSRETI